MDLEQQVRRLMNTDIRKVIDRKIKEFRSITDKKEIFKELCFCLLTANFNAYKSIIIQEAINDGFLFLEEQELAKRLKQLHHRYPNMRARFIVEARNKIDLLQEILRKDSQQEIRRLLVKNFKGLGMKEASHFMRNIGLLDIAIIDFHIIDILVRNGLIEKPDRLTEKKYLEIESLLRQLAERIGISLGELDLYLWYLETGKIYK